MGKPQDQGSDLAVTTGGEVITEAGETTEAEGGAIMDTEMIIMIGDLHRPVTMTEDMTVMSETTTPHLATIVMTTETDTTEIPETDTTSRTDTGTTDTESQGPAVDIHHGQSRTDMGGPEGVPLLSTRGTSTTTSTRGTGTTTGMRDLLVTTTPVGDLLVLARLDLLLGETTRAHKSGGSTLNFY